MQIQINPKQDQKLLQNYPDDPYSDLCIVTQTRRLNLVLAYLSIDSNYFSKIDPDTRQIDLTHLNQDPLLRVIRSLYGEELIANTVSQLTELYDIIRYLQIDDYRSNIQKEIKEKPYILESIQFLEFSFRSNLLVDYVINFHIQNKLKLLQNNRNYLQLNKISIETFQTLITAFIEKMIQIYGSIQNLLGKPQSQIINHVMENYFNRNNIKAGNYFKNNTLCADMETIWNKFHHSIYYPESSTNLSMKGSNIFPLKPPQMSTRLRKKSDQIQSVNEIQTKKKKIQQLQRQIKQRDQIIYQLEKQIKDLKQTSSISSTSSKPPKMPSKRNSGPNPQTVTQVMDEQQLKRSQESLSFLPNINRKSKKSKQYDQEEDFTVSSVFEPAFNANRKIPQMKEIRTMKKVGSTSTGVKNKFLPS